MTRKKRLFQRIRRVFYLTLSLTFYVLLFCFVDNDFLAASSLVLAIAFLVVFAASFMIKQKPNLKLKEALRKSIFDNPISLKEVNKIYRYKNLDTMQPQIIKLYFHKTEPKRCMIFKESNSVRIAFEKLEYFDDQTKSWTFEYAQWDGDYTTGGIYADEKLAINDNKKILADYVEDKTKIERRKAFNAEIEWQNLDINSKLIPFGSYNNFEIQFKGSPVVKAIIHNTNWLDMSTSIAKVFISENLSLNTDKPSKFKIIYDGKTIGKGFHTRD